MGELRLFGQPEGAFSGDHDDLTGVIPDQHHAKSHAHDGADGSGQVVHGSLTGVSADQHHAQLHKAAHISGGGDAFAGGDLLDATARVAIRKNSGGADVGARRRLNLIEGNNITLTVADDTANEEIDITIAAAGGGGGGLLAYTVYDPASEETKSTTSTSFVDVDAANLAVTFTAPSSGKVLIRLTALALLGTTATTRVYWNLCQGSNNISGSAGVVTVYSHEHRISHAVVLTGLTSGNEYTYKWGFRSGYYAHSARINVGGDAGPAVMEVWAA